MGGVTYDPRLLNVVTDMGVITGHSKDKKASFEYNEEQNFEHVDVDGNVDRAKNANKSGILTIPLKGTSPWISILHAKANMPGDEDKFDISVEDLNTNGVNVSGSGCWIKSLPTIEKGKEIEDGDAEIFIPRAIVK